MSINAISALFQPLVLCHTHTPGWSWAAVCYLTDQISLRATRLSKQKACGQETPDMVDHAKLSSYHANASETHTHTHTCPGGTVHEN